MRNNDCVHHRKPMWIQSVRWMWSDPNAVPPQNVEPLDMGVVFNLFPKPFDRPEDQRKRSPQFMGDARDQAQAHLLEFTQVGLPFPDGPQSFFPNVNSRCKQQAAESQQQQHANPLPNLSTNPFSDVFSELSPESSSSSAAGSIGKTVRIKWDEKQ
jgi:hypothetical protein